MDFAIVEGRKTPRNLATGRRLGRSSRPSVEVMEGRQLLSGIPMMYSNSASVVEHGTAPATMNFTVHLTSPSDQPVSVDYQTTDASAQSGLDYIAAGGTLTFAPGQMSATIAVTVLPDLAATSNRAFSLNLGNAQGGMLFTPKLNGTIIEQNTPPPPKLTIDNQQLTLGADGSSGTMTFDVSLNEALSYPVTVTAATSDLTAIAGVNYAATSQVLTFAPGQTTAQFTVAIYGSTTVATDYFLVGLSNASVAIGQAQGAGTIVY